MTKQSKFRNCFIPVLLILTVSLAVPLFLFAEDSGKNNNSPRDSSPQQISSAQEKPTPYSNADISVKVIPSANKTYGYDILLYGRPLVHQPNIPGLSGNEGFTTKKRAQTVANFVVKKIRNNEMPPTVTIEDLNKMDVLK
jgi:hypothetical protein